MHATRRLTALLALALLLTQAASADGGRRAEMFQWALTQVRVFEHVLRKDAHVRDIELNAYEAGLCVGETFPIVHIQPSEKPAVVQFYSLDEDIVDIGRGNLISAREPGATVVMAVITPRDAEPRYSACYVTVKASDGGSSASTANNDTRERLHARIARMARRWQSTESIITKLIRHHEAVHDFPLNSHLVTLKPSERFALERVSPEAEAPLRYIVMQDNVVSISERGVIEALSPGEAVIVAMQDTEDPGFATCRVIVK